MNHDCQLIKLHLAFRKFRNAGLREGQSWFNALFEVDPKVATKITGTAADPFQQDSNMNLFWEVVHREWGIT